MTEPKSKQRDSGGSEMSRKKQVLNDVELRLISELMKNSRRSDRELSRAIGVSQPTITRVRTKLERIGVIKEYTMIPDFQMLGYSIMGATLLGLREPFTEGAFEEVKKATLKIEESNPHAALLAVNILGGDKDRLFITLYESYSDYVESMQLTRRLPFVDVESVQSFLVNLTDETNYRVLSMSAIARHVQARLGKEGVKP